MKFRSLLVIAMIIAGVFVIGCKKEEPVTPVGGEEGASSLMKAVDDAAATAKDAAVEAEKSAEAAAKEAAKMVCTKCNMPTAQCTCPK